ITERGVVDDAAAARLRHLAFVQRARMTPLLGALFETLDLFAAENIETVPLKGPALAHRIYPASGLRPSFDLDLMVAEADLDRSLAALERAGYLFDAEANALYLRAHHHHLHAMHPDKPFMLELHFRAFSGLGSAIASEPLLARAMPATVG